MASIPTINANQTEQAPVVGQLDLQAGRSAGCLSGVVSPNNGGRLPAGSSVYLDSANTGKLPWFLVVASAATVAIGRSLFTERSSDPDLNDAVEVALGAGGPIVWCVADGTLTPGALVQDGADGPQFVDAVTSGKQRGICIDYGTAGQLVRVITLPSVS